MSLLQPHLTKMSLLELGYRMLRNGSQAAVMTPFRRTDAPDAVQSNIDVGWDLIRQEHRVRATGARILHLFGEVLSFDGHTVPNAVVEIRQSDMLGRSIADQRHASDFFGIGRTVTDFEGRYQFRTILPTPDRTCSAHIDATVAPATGRKLSTRLYLLNHDANDHDWNYIALGPSRQAAVSLDPIERPDGDLDAGFNFVL